MYSTYVGAFLKYRADGYKRAQPNLREGLPQRSGPAQTHRGRAATEVGQQARTAGPRRG
jgi:hypothetical protein